MTCKKLKVSGKMVVQREYFTDYFKTQILGLEIDAEHVHRGLATNTTITNQNKRN